MISSLHHSNHWILFDTNFVILMHNMGSNRDNFMPYLLLVLDIYSTSNTRHFFQIDHIRIMCVSVANIYLFESVCVESLKNEEKKSNMILKWEYTKMNALAQRRTHFYNAYHFQLGKIGIFTMYCSSLRAGQIKLRCYSYEFNSMCQVTQCALSFFH